MSYLADFYKDTELTRCTVPNVTVTGIIVNKDSKVHFIILRLSRKGFVSMTKSILIKLGVEKVIIFHMRMVRNNESLEKFFK